MPTPCGPIWSSSTSTCRGSTGTRSCPGSRPTARCGSIPVVVLTTSNSRDDVRRSYDLHANAYVTKPADLHDFTRVVRQVDEFFLGVAQLPPRV